MNRAPDPRPSSRLAIVADDGMVTHADLGTAANAVAGGLLVDTDDLEGARVAFRVPPGVSHVAVQRGIWRAGGVAVPLATMHPRAELEYVLRNSGARLAVGLSADMDSTADAASRTGTRFVEVAELLAAAQPPVLPHVEASRRALIIYTSGTTGQPKGAVSTHANIGAQVASLVSAWKWRSDDRLLLVLPLHHVHGIINGLGCVMAVRASCELPSRFDAGQIWTRLASGEVSVFTAVPTIYRRLIAAWDEASPDTRSEWSGGAARVRLMMSGSAALPVSTLERWKHITGHTLLERYGMTELGMVLSNPLEGLRRPGTVGTPLPDVEVRLVDDSGTMVADGEPGEIEVRGPNVFLEYWRRPEETSTAFRGGWFRTGDVALVEDGYYRLLGRNSVDIIKTGGYKVSAIEIEEALREHPVIADCAVVGVPDDEWGERVVAAIEVSPGEKAELEEIASSAKQRLAPYKVPRVFRVVDALPRNAMGKVVKPEVRRLFSDS